MKPLAFPKHLRLCSAREVDALFARGKSTVSFPLRVVTLSLPLGDTAPSSPKVLFAVPRRRFKTAVARNLIRRRMREAYRIHCAPLVHEPSCANLRLAFIYISDQVLPYAPIEKAMVSLLRRLAKGCKAAGGL